MKVENLAKAISDKNRVRIINYLIKGPQKVSSISDKLEMEENLTSHHLRVLQNLGYLKSQKRGREVIYSINRAKFLSNIKDLLRNKFFKEMIEEITSTAADKKSTKSRKNTP
jgi:DNA-binding transcriptional ArsR family regulator